MFELSSLTTIKGQDLKWRLIRSACLLLSYFAHGMTLGTVGPTMLDIQIRTNSTISEVTYIIIGRAAGLTIGSFLAGPITSRIDTQLCISLALILAGIGTAGVPWPQNVNYTIVTYFFSGLGYGIEETSLYLYMFYLWGAEGEPFIQALHFSFGAGASVAPLVASRFILPRNESFVDEWTPDDVKVHWCYTIIALVSVLTAFVFLFLYKCGPLSEEHPSRVGDGDDDNDQVRDRELKPTISMIKLESERRKGLAVKALCILLLCVYCFFYCGIEVNFGAYLTPYAVDGPIHMTKENGAYIAAAYWSVFTFSRLLTIFYIKPLGSRNNLILCSFILLVANIVLIPFNNNEACLWVGSVLVGLGASSIFASLFGYLEQSIRVTPLITSFTIASGCLGQSIFPVITSHFFVQDSKVFLWLTLGATVAMAVFLVLIIVFFEWHSKLMKERMEALSKRRFRPTFGRLNSMMSVASDTGMTMKKKKKKKKIDGAAQPD